MKFTLYLDWRDGMYRVYELTDKERDKITRLRWDGHALL